MKILKVISATLLLLIGLMVSCQDEFLEVLPTASLDEAQLASRNGLEGSLVGAYSILLGRGGFYDASTNWLWGSITGGDANKGTNAGDQAVANEIQAFDPQTTNPEVKNKYARTYEGIARANATLKLLQQAGDDVPEAVKTRIEAESKFLRGHYYFELKKIYGDTPFLDENWNGVDPVANDRDLWQFIEADFQFAYDNLFETHPDAGRANKWAAASYLAKTYLYQQKYAQAKPLFDQVIASGVTTNGKRYDLVPLFQDIFKADNDNHEESIFAIQAAAGTGSINNANPELVLNFPYNGGPAGCCGFFQPSFDLTNSYRTNNGLPLLDGSYNSAANALVTDMGVTSQSAFTPDGGPVDPRLDHTAGRRGIPYLDWGPHPGFDWIRDQAYGGPYTPKKWIYYKSDEGRNIDGSSWTPGYTALNVTIIRFADVLLMAAEVEVEIGDLNRAREYVNRVRERAANSESFVRHDDGELAANYQIALYTAPWTDQNVAREAVRMERKLELAMEGQRFFDLNRWGVSAPVLNAYLAHENSKLPASPFVGATFTANKNERMPIPQDEIDLLGADVLRQNPGY